MRVRTLEIDDLFAKLFLNAACSSAVAARRCCGRGTCKVKPSRRITRHAVLWLTLVPVRSAIQRATFGAVHSPPSAGSERRARSKAWAASESRRGRRPGATAPRASGTASAPRWLKRRASAVIHPEQRPTRAGRVVGELAVRDQIQRTPAQFFWRVAARAIATVEFSGRQVRLQSDASWHRQVLLYLR